MGVENMNTLHQYPNLDKSQRLTSFNSFNVGTGGLNTPNAFKIFVIRHQPSSNIEVEFDKNEISLKSPKQYLEEIRKYLHISIVDLSFIFNVTRPTIYSWLEGVEPKPDTIEHIQQLSNFAQELEGYKIANIGKLLHRPIFNGHSLLEYFRTQKNLPNAWNLFKESLLKELNRRSYQKGSGKGLKDIKQTVNENSTYLFKD